MRLRLVEPLGFDLSEPTLEPAGLDANDLASVTTHPDLDALLAARDLTHELFDTCGDRVLTRLSRRSRNR